MQFKEWFLTEETKIRFTMFSSDGKVRVLIGDKKYQYVIDPMLIYKIQGISKRKPFAALNMLKKLMNNGQGTWERIE